MCNLVPQRLIRSAIFSNDTAYSCHKKLTNLKNEKKINPKYSVHLNINEVIQEHIAWSSVLWSARKEKVRAELWIPILRPRCCSVIQDIETLSIVQAKTHIVTCHTLQSQHTGWGSKSQHSRNVQVTRCFAQYQFSSLPQASSNSFSRFSLFACFSSLTALRCALNSFSPACAQSSSRLTNPLRRSISCYLNIKIKISG